MANTIECVVHGVNIRDAPNASANISSGLLRGQQATVDSFAYGQWLHVTAPHVGYLWPGSAIAPNVRLLDVVVTPPAPTPSGDMMKVRTTDYLWVRSGPGTNKTKLVLLSPGMDQIVYAHVAVKANDLTWYQIAAPTQQWIAAKFTVIVSDTVPSPPPTSPPVPAPNTPNLPWNLPITATQRGGHFSAGGWRPSPGELNLARDNHLETALIVCYEPGQAQIAIHDFRSVGINHFILRAETHEKPTTVQRFLDLTLPILKEYRDAIGTSENLMIAIHNEPNLYSEGFGQGWNNGAQFASWWAGVAQVYRNVFPGCKLGFPAVSGGGAVPNIRVNEIQFVQEAAAAIRAADWVGVHDYWQRDDGSDFNPPILIWRQMYGSKPLVGTEIGPVNAGVVTAGAVLNAYQKMAAAGIPVMAWIVNGTGGFDNADWTRHPFKLPNPSDPPAPAPQPTTPPVQEGEPQPYRDLYGMSIAPFGPTKRFVDSAQKLQAAGHAYAAVTFISDMELANKMATLVKVPVFRYVWGSSDTEPYKPSILNGLTEAQAIQVGRDFYHGPHKQFNDRVPAVKYRCYTNEADWHPMDYAFYLGLAMENDKVDPRYKIVAFNDRVGQPEIDQWQRRIPALRYLMANGHLAGLNEYSRWITGPDGKRHPTDKPVSDPEGFEWYGGRHDTLYNAVPKDCWPKLLIKETGPSDATFRDAKRFTDDAHAYNLMLQKYPYVIGFCWYRFGPPGYDDFTSALDEYEEMILRG